MNLHIDSSDRGLALQTLVGMVPTFAGDAYFMDVEVDPTDGSGPITYGGFLMSAQPTNVGTHRVRTITLALTDDLAQVPNAERKVIDVDDITEVTIPC